VVPRLVRLDAAARAAGATCSTRSVCAARTSGGRSSSRNCTSGTSGISGT